jgi:hypothetical protein
MVDASEGEIPEGAALFPLIPAELGVDPLLLAVLHATVFVAGSDESIVNQDAAAEAVEYLAGYLRRLDGARLEQVREDMDCLVRYARQQGWPKQFVRSLQDFLVDYGIGEEGKG